MLDRFTTNPYRKTTQNFFNKVSKNSSTPDTREAGVKTNPSSFKEILRQGRQSQVRVEFEKPQNLFTHTHMRPGHSKQQPQSNNTLWSNA